MDIKLRDYFAATALRVLLGRFEPTKYPVSALTKDAYAVADAMIVESSK